jgi:hypothetical protein
MNLVQLVANHTVRVTITPGQAAIPAMDGNPAVPAKRPVFMDVQKGGMFLIDAETASDLVRLGAATYYKAQPLGEVVVAASGAADETVAEGSRRRGPRKIKNPATEPVLDGDEGEDQV